MAAAAAPHVAILPFPAQGHIKPMLILAELLYQTAGFTVTFVNNEHSHWKIDRTAFLRRCPDMRFVSISDGLPPEHTRSGDSVTDLFFSTPIHSRPAFKELVAASEPPVTCVISDGIMSFAIDVAEELGIPAITFRTYSATCTWVYFHLDKLIQQGEIPVTEAMDRLIPSIPGLETIMRGRDLPHICRLDSDNPLLQFYIAQTLKMKKSSTLILNTFEELESPIIDQLRLIFPTVYAIGPLHLSSSGDSSLTKIDNSSINWLDSQPSKSVLYVSFGSIIVPSREELLEFWHGLVNSGKRFLWAIRPDLIESGPSKITDELKSRTKELGRIVGWAPQEEILAHEAIGGFLTHSGWNSTLESISFGKPMICWPRLADQQVNSRCVSEIWRVGIDLKDICDRSTVESVVRDLMDGREDIVGSAVEFARLAGESVREGGSMDRNIKKLIEDIKLMHSKSGASGK